MSNRLVAVKGDVALVAGSTGISARRIPSMEVIGSAPGIYTDVDFSGDRPVAIAIKPGNPATGSLRVWNGSALGAYSFDKPSYNSPYIGRIAGDGGEEFMWAQGSKIRVDTADSQGRVVETPKQILDIGFVSQVEAAIATGNEVMVYDIRSTSYSWTNVLPARPRSIVASPKYVVAWGGGILTGGSLSIPVTVLSPTNGTVITTINQVGLNLIACAAIAGDKLYIGKPKYVTGQDPTGQIEVYDLGTPTGSPERVVEVARPPLSIATTSDGGCVWVNGEPGYIAASALGNVIEPTESGMDPYEAFSFNLVMTPKERAIMDLIAALAPQDSVQAYIAILLALRG